uniref:Glycosyltransferase n=1 Tax=Fagus sylvatica TaxID=28930 RepID=A0A2N9FHC7_FAGSY
MSSEPDQLHVLFFPLMAHGHLLPTLDIARLFAARGVKTTIITTPKNAHIFTKTIEKTQNSSAKISLKIIEFPAKEVGLPEGLENLDLITDQETHQKFFSAMSLLEQPLNDILRELYPHGLVADMFFPWATDVASKHGIPRLVFHGTSFFSMCAANSVAKFKPHKTVSSNTDPFVLPGLPDKIELTSLQIADHIRLGFENDFTRLLGRAHEAENRSFGMLAQFLFAIGISKRKPREETQTQTQPPLRKHDYCLKWLGSKKPNSVVYVCFGTNSNFPASQLREIALGLEASGQEFIWVVKKNKNDDDQQEDWLPEGYEKRMEGKGLIIRGWAPQVLILEHESVGGFVTHCGWNSALEGISAGLPMVTWPIFAEQFYNEKLITDVLKIGVGVGAQQWIRLVGDFIKREAIEKAVKEIMVGEKVEEMRSRAKTLGELAKSTVEEGGSSYTDLGLLIKELKSYGALKQARLSH